MSATQPDPFELGDTSELPAEACPYCGNLNDAATGPGELLESQKKEQKPEPGVFLCCVYCGGWSVLDDNMRSHKVNKEELAIIQREAPLMYEMSLKLQRN